MGKAAVIEAEQDHLEARYGVEQPYTIEVQLRGLTPFLFNRFADLDGYAEKRVATKRVPTADDTRDYEAMVWRTDDGKLGLPNLNVIASTVNAGRYFKSPIAGSGGATTTLREALVAGQEYASFSSDEWDCIDFRLARNGDMKRSPKPTYRPRMEVGWSLTANIGVVTPELYRPTKLLEVINRAGTVGGVGDGRRIGFGRFAIEHFEVADGLPW